MKNQFILTLLLISFSTVSALASAVPPTPTTVQEDETIWNKYCGGNRLSSEIPKPNYKDTEVISAVKKLAMVSPYSYYFYAGPLYAYDLRISKTKDLIEAPANFPAIAEVKNGKKNAHAFMTVLCGEFRDRPSLIKEKISWIQKMYTLPDAPQKPVNLNHELWSQMSAQSYSNYIGNTRMLFAAKQAENIKQNLRAQIGQYNEDYPVEPFSVCETKFIFKKYVETKSQFNPQNDGFRKYKSEYNRFKDRCPKADLEHFYDFRGDSNFKPNSPEANGMIWYSSSISNSCIRKDGKMILKDSMKEKFSDQEICEKYFTSPFKYRWSAARAGLATWLFHEATHNAIFSNSRAMVTIIPNHKPFDGPFAFKIPFEEYFDEQNIMYKNAQDEYVAWDDATGKEVVLTPEQVAEKQKMIETKKAEIEEKKKNADTAQMDFLKIWMQNQNEFWNRSDMGFNTIVGFTHSGQTAQVSDKVQSANKELAFERLRNAVNRHTDWYASRYDDGLGTVREQAYSPFVASSYEMSASDAFTSPGVTVQSPSDGCKQWMFVFKLKNDQWYNTRSIVNKTPIDFNRHWLDETSLGTNHLADSEHALDRLGTALEGEMDAILYLHNIESGGTVNAKCGNEQM